MDLGLKGDFRILKFPKEEKEQTIKEMDNKEEPTTTDTPAGISGTEEDVSSFTFNPDAKKKKKVVKKKKAPSAAGEATSTGEGGEVTGTDGGAAGEGGENPVSTNTKKVEEKKEEEYSYDLLLERAFWTDW